ncbi:MAG: family 10 glycosylhydrolase, partial [Clostridia bacterium]|nr:family 10 glycosylhydrolase [Clostridia bacterium]
GLKMIMCGEYNLAYTDYYLKKGTKIMIDSLDEANSYSDLPSVVIEGGVIEFTSENSNINSISKEGVYYYDFGFKARVTPEIENLPRKDIVFVDGYVASVSEENARTLIPDGNGFVLTLAGKDTIEKYSGIKEGSHTDSFYTDYKVFADRYLRINGNVYAVDKIDALRQPEGVCVLYTPDFGADTGTNKYGVEIVIKDNKVIAVESGTGSAAIPENGYVLSIHKDNEMYSEALSIKEGDEVALRLSPDYSVNLLSYDGINSVRHENQLIVYKENKRTGTNVYGYEIIVDADGTVTGEGISGNSVIPEGGFVLSGHGKSADLLKGIYALGERVTLDTQNKSVIVVRTPGIKITAAADNYSGALKNYEKAKKNYININYEDAQKTLDYAKELLDGAEKAFGEYDYLTAASKADEAALMLKYFDYGLIPSHAVENRAMWYRSTAKSDEAVREELMKLKALNVNTLYLETWYGGSFIGFTDMEDVEHSSANGDYDALEGFVRIGHELGIEIHCWVENFFVGYTSGSSYTSAMARRFADKLLLDKKGRNYFYYHETASFVFMNPYDRECRDTILELYRKIVEKYDIDGLHLDYIRFPELNYIDGVSDFGYNEDIIAGFRAKTGITGDPHDFAPNSKEQQAWIEFRCEIITSFVKEVRDEVLSIKPDLWISAATYPDVKMAHDSIFQDMATWAKTGLVDELFSMTYSADNAFVREDARSYAEFCEGNCFYSTGLAAFTDTDQVNFAHQLSEVRENGADGVAVFSLANIYPYTYQYEIQKGAFRDPSVQGYKLYETVTAAMNEMIAKLNNLKGVYKHITAENAESVSTVCAGIIHDAAEFRDAAEPARGDKISYCEKTVERLKVFKTEIKEIAGDNAEAKDLCADIDSLIYVLELTAKRLSAR